jgi:hypothetical protein
LEGDRQRELEEEAREAQAFYLNPYCFNASLCFVVISSVLIAGWASCLVGSLYNLKKDE